MDTSLGKVFENRFLRDISVSYILLASFLFIIINIAEFELPVGLTSETGDCFAMEVARWSMYLS